MCWKTLSIWGFILLFPNKKIKISFNCQQESIKFWGTHCQKVTVFSIDNLGPARPARQVLPPTALGGRAAAGGPNRHGMALVNLPCLAKALLVSVNSSPLTWGFLPPATHNQRIEKQILPGFPPETDTCPRGSHSRPPRKRSGSPWRAQRWGACPSLLPRQAKIRPAPVTGPLTGAHDGHALGMLLQFRPSCPIRVANKDRSTLLPKWWLLQQFQKCHIFLKNNPNQKTVKCNG